MKTFMKQTGAMVWKEWREARWLAWAGFALFVVAPAFTDGAGYTRWAASWSGTVSNNHGHWITMPSFAVVVYGLGAAFAAFTAIALAVRDLRDGVSEPWRQTPISPWRFMATKFLIGFVIVFGTILTALVLHLAVAFYVGTNVQLLGANSNNGAIRDALQNLTSHVFMLMAVYALSFGLAALFRPVLSALLVCVIVIGLLYFLPILVPAMSFMNLFELLEQPAFWSFDTHERTRYFSGASRPVQLLGYWVVYNRMLPVFVMVMLGLTLIASVAALVVAVRGWRIELHVQRVAWTLAVAFLGLFGIAAIQVGNNLEPVAVLPVSVDKSRTVVELHADGDALLLSLVEIKKHGPRDYTDAHDKPMNLLRADLTNPMSLQFVHTPTSLMSGPSYAFMFKPQLAWSADRPEIVFFIQQHWRDKESMPDRLDLVVMNVYHHGDPAQESKELVRLNLYQWVEELKYREDTSMLLLSLYKNRLFLYSNLRLTERYPSILLTFDVTDPKSPTLVSRQPLRGRLNSHFHLVQNNHTIELFEIPGLDALQRSALMWKLTESFRPADSEGHLIVQWDEGREGGLRVYERKHIDDKRMTYVLTGERRMTPLESALSQNDADDALLSDGLLYVLGGQSHNSMMVFDVRDPTKPRKVGHYYAPGERLRCLAATGDGRVIAAGDALHVFDLRDRVGPHPKPGP